jgi:hypothetical protein
MFTYEESFLAALGVIVPFFVFMSLISFSPLVFLKAADGELSDGIRLWLSGSFYLCIWMLISYLGNVMYIDMRGGVDNGPKSLGIESTTWLDGVVLSIESVLHGVVLAPAAPEISVREDLMFGGVSHGGSGKSLAPCYIIFVLGYVLLALYYANYTKVIENLKDMALWIFGVILAELLLLFWLESVFTLFPSLVVLRLFSIELNLRTMALFFGIANIVIFWWILLSSKEEY